MYVCICIGICIFQFVFVFHDKKENLQQKKLATHSSCSEFDISTQNLFNFCNMTNDQHNVPSSCICRYSHLVVWLLFHFLMTSFISSFSSSSMSAGKRVLSTLESFPNVTEFHLLSNSTSSGSSTVCLIPRSFKSFLFSMTVFKRARSSGLPEFSKARQWLSHSGSSPLSSDMTSAPALKGKASIKHRKNCECCPVSLLMVRSQRLSEFRFSIVRIISVSNVASLQDCLCNCQNGKNNCLNCLNCQKCQKCQKCFLLTPYLSSCPTFQGDHLSPAM